jgi:hypothetical protein
MSHAIYHYYKNLHLTNENWTEKYRVISETGFLLTLRWKEISLHKRHPQPTVMVMNCLALSECWGLQISHVIQRKLHSMTSIVMQSGIHIKWFPCQENPSAHLFVGETLMKSHIISNSTSVTSHHISNKEAWQYGVHECSQLHLVLPGRQCKIHSKR